MPSLPLRRVKRSSSAKATSFPSWSKQAAGFFPTPMIPRMFIQRLRAGPDVMVAKSVSSDLEQFVVDRRAGLDRMHEAVEQITGIVRPWARLRVELDRQRAQTRMREAFEAA